jgi:hypothetical protein
MALPYVFSSLRIRLRELRRIYFFGWDREVAQHGPDLSEPQIAEARAWGRGAARPLRLVGTPAPTPPYPARQVCLGEAGAPEPARP